MKLLFLGALMAIPALLNAYPDPRSGPSVATGRGNIYRPSSYEFGYVNGDGYQVYDDDKEFNRPRRDPDPSIATGRGNITRPSSYEFGYDNGVESNQYDKEVNSVPTEAGYGRDPSAGIRNSVPTEAGYGHDPSSGIRKPFPIMPHRRMTLLEAFFVFERFLNGQHRFEGQRKSLYELKKLKAEVSDLILRGLMYKEVVLAEPQHQEELLEYFFGSFESVKLENKVKEFFAHYNVEIFFFAEYDVEMIFEGLNLRDSIPKRRRNGPIITGPLPFPYRTRQATRSDK